jgi:FkbM family methyltransferase
MSDTPRLAQGDSFRTKSLPERIADALPSGGVIGRLRRPLKPIFNALLGRKHDLESVLPGGEVVHVAPAYRHISWNPEEYDAFRRAVRPGQTVIEAGANVGAYSVLFGQWVGSGGRVFAFEPDPQAFDGLRQHLALNDLTSRVTVVPAAVTDGVEARVRFALGESSGISRRVLASEPPAARLTDVDAVSIDQFCARERITPDVIKVDVEGAELAVLRGARATIAAAGPSLQLFVEMHPQLWPSLGYSAADIQRECAEQRLVVERFDGRRDGVWDIEGVCLRLRPIV